MGLAPELMEINQLLVNLPCSDLRSYFSDYQSKAQELNQVLYSA